MHRNVHKRFFHEAMNLAKCMIQVRVYKKISGIYKILYRDEKFKNLGKLGNIDRSCSLEKIHIICHYFLLHSQQAKLLDDDVLGQQFSLGK